MPSKIQAIEKVIMSSEKTSSYDHLFNCIKDPVVCQKCYDEFAQGQTDAGSPNIMLPLMLGLPTVGCKSGVAAMI